MASKSSSRGDVLVAAPAEGARREASVARRTRERMTLGQQIRREWIMLLLVLPGLLFYLIFYYIPLLGNVIAFQDYQPFLGFRESPFVGLANFTAMFQNSEFFDSLRNTLEITLLQLILYFPAPIALALLLNSLVSDHLKRLIQSIVYLPHFISWVIVVILWQQILGGAGLIDHALLVAGVKNPIDIMSDPSLFKVLVTAQVIWKDTGWGMIIFLAALTTIDVALYEAAAVDGASAFRRLWHVTLPGIRSIIILLLILRLGTTLSVGFEQIVLQQNAVGARAGEVLDTFVYFHGIIDGDWGMGAAVGLVKGLVGFALVVGANWLAHQAGEQGVM